MAALESDVVVEGFRGGINKKAMEFAESEVRICCRRVGVGSGVIDSVVYTFPQIRASPMWTVRSPMESTASLRRLSTVHGLRAES